MIVPDSALDWLDRAQRFGIKLGLANVRALLDALGNPEQRLRIIHVAGTNGKGSVCAMLESVLRTAGHRTGLYTSPHLVDLRERFRVNGGMIPPSTLEQLLARIRAASADWTHQPTYFEITTALALLWFAETHVDIAILETGMGGRLDATNIVAPIASIITAIGMDHQEYLGDTLEKIAAEKAGIIKPGIPVITAPQAPEAMRVISETAARLSSPLHTAEPTEIPAPLAGAHQRQNTDLVVTALRVLDSIPDDAMLRTGLARTFWPGRFHEVGGFILDGAHNPAGSAMLVETWRTRFGADRTRIIFGGMADKNLPAMIAALDPIADEFSFVPVQNPRSASPNELPQWTTVPSRVFDTLESAMTDRNNRPVLITGSLYLVGEALTQLRVPLYPEFQER